MELLTCNTVCSSHTVFDQVLFNVQRNENPGHWCQGNVLEWNMKDFCATFRTLSPSLCPLMKRNSAHFVFFLLSMNCLVGIVAYRPCAIRILASYALVSLTTTSLSFVSLLSGHFLEKRRTRYELRIRICYQKWSSFNLPLHLLLTAWAVVCRWHPALPVTTGINPETVRSFQYELKQWNCTKISIPSSIACSWTRKTFLVNILRSLSQVLETMYASTE